MAKPKLSEQQWADVRTAYLSTDREIRDIAREFGITDAAINKKKLKEGWGPRNASARKRHLVNAASAGLVSGLTAKPNQSPAEAAIHAAAAVDVEDMDLAISVGRKLLGRCAQLLELGGEDAPFLAPKDLANVATTWKMAFEGIRKIRGLDEPAPPAPETSPLEVLAAGLDKARKARAECS